MQVQAQRRKEFSVEDVVEMVQRESASIPNEHVYFSLKKMRLKPVFPQTVETMRLCLAAHRLGLRVTTFLISNLRGCTEESAMASLHILGDKKCLTILRGSKTHCLQWIVSLDFLRHYGEEGF